MPEKIEETPLRRISREFGDSGLFPAEVHKLYEAGRARKAQAALRAHIPKELNSGRKRRQQQYLDDPYLWLEPLDKAPSMHTINGIGTMLYGHYQPNADGIYIATLWFVVLFIPIFPLGAYVVRKAGGNSWTFYAKAPLPPTARFWRFGFAGLVLASIALVFGLAAWDKAHAELWLYNGFEVPMQVTVADESFDLAPRQLRRAGSYAVGAVALEARPEGWAVPIDQRQADLGLLGDDELLYNVAGRASLVRGWVVYGPGMARDDELLGTEPIVPVGSVDYLLREPPESKSVREGGSIVDEVVYNAEDEVPFSVVAFFTQSVVSPADAWRMLAARLAVAPDDDQALALATTLRAPGDPDFLAVGELARNGQPELVDAHRLYQISLGEEQTEAARAEYLALADEHSDSAMYQYLAGRLLEDGSPEAGARFRKALEIDPDYAWAHLALGYQLATRGELSEALASYERYATSSPEAGAEVLRSRARVLQMGSAEGWQDQVRALLDGAEAQQGLTLDVITLRAVFEASQGAQPLEQTLAVLDASVGQLAASQGDEFMGSGVLASLDVLLAAGDVAGARALLDELDPAMDSWALAKGELFLAVASSDSEVLRGVLDQHMEVFTGSPSSMALFGAAGALALDHSAAPELLEMARTIARIGSASPSVVLEDGADLGSPASLDELLAPVPFEARGLGYAAAAILVEHSGGDAATLAHARGEALRLLLPDECPPWL